MGALLLHPIYFIRFIGWMEKRVKVFNYLRLSMQRMIFHSSKRANFSLSFLLWNSSPEDVNRIAQSIPWIILRWTMFLHNNRLNQTKSFQFMCLKTGRIWYNVAISFDLQLTLSSCKALHDCIITDDCLINQTLIIHRWSINVIIAISNNQMDQLMQCELELLKKNYKYIFFITESQYHININMF